MKKIFIPAFAALTFMGLAGCHSSSQQSASQEADGTAFIEPTDSVNPILSGTYKGTFPCADCGGKEVALTIASDGTYNLKYKYSDKDERVFEENGIYNLIDDTLIETVTPSSGEKTYYAYVHGNLVLSDSLGTVNKGELAELYILKKQ